MFLPQQLMKIRPMAGVDQRKETGTVKAVLRGPPETGKSTFLAAMTDPDPVRCRIKQTGPAPYLPTIGLEFNAVKVLVLGKDLIRFHVWDTAGVERFQPIVRSYFRAVNCFLYFLPTWEEREKAEGRLQEDLAADLFFCDREVDRLVFLIGSVRQDRPRLISSEEGAAIAERANVKQYIEIDSVEHPEAVMPILHDIATILLQERPDRIYGRDPRKSSTHSSATPQIPSSCSSEDHEKWFSAIIQGYAGDHLPEEERELCLGVSSSATAAGGLRWHYSNPSVGKTVAERRRELLLSGANALEYRGFDPGLPDLLRGMPVRVLGCLTAGWYRGYFTPSVDPATWLQPLQWALGSPSSPIRGLCVDYLTPSRIESMLLEELLTTARNLTHIFVAVNERSWGSQVTVGPSGLLDLRRAAKATTAVGVDPAAEVPWKLMPLQLSEEYAAQLWTLEDCTTAMRRIEKEVQEKLDAVRLAQPALPSTEGVMVEFQTKSGKARAQAPVSLVLKYSRLLAEMLAPELEGSSEESRVIAVPVLLQRDVSDRALKGAFGYLARFDAITQDPNCGAGTLEELADVVCEGTLGNIPRLQALCSTATFPSVDRLVMFGRRDGSMLRFVFEVFELALYFNIPVLKVACRRELMARCEEEISSKHPPPPVAAPPPAENEPHVPGYHTPAGAPWLLVPDPIQPEDKPKPRTRRECVVS